MGMNSSTWGAFHYQSWEALRTWAQDCRHCQGHALWGTAVRTQVWSFLGSLCQRDGLIPGKGLQGPQPTSPISHQPLLTSLSQEPALGSQQPLSPPAAHSTGWVGSLCITIPMATVAEKQLFLCLPDTTSLFPRRAHKKITFPSPLCSWWSIWLSLSSDYEQKRCGPLLGFGS